MLKSSLGYCNGSGGGWGFFSTTTANAAWEHYYSYPALPKRPIFLSKTKNHSLSCSLRADDFISKTHKPQEEVFERKGDVCLTDLLFTTNRDFLVKNNNQQVKAEQLLGKVVVIFFVPLNGYPHDHLVH